MKDFLRAEWKTLLVVVLAAIAVWFVFQREEEEIAERQAATSTIAEDATVVPGERLGALTLELDALRTLLGEPSGREPIEPGLEALHHEAHGVSVYLERSSGRLAAVSLDIPVADPAIARALVAPNGEDLVARWDHAMGSLGPVLAQQNLATGRTLVRFDGLLVEVKLAEGKATPSRISLLPKMPESLFAAYREQP